VGLLSSEAKASAASSSPEMYVSSIFTIIPSTEDEDDVGVLAYWFGVDTPAGLLFLRLVREGEEAKTGMVMLLMFISGGCWVPLDLAASLSADMNSC